MKKMKNLIIKIQEKTKIYLSHHPWRYAMIVGIGVVLFWRGVWHTADFLHGYFGTFQNNLSLGFSLYSWWDGPLSLVVSIIILFFTGAFRSSFIGNELILSGLREEKKLSQKTEVEVKTEEQFVSDIKQELEIMTDKIEELEKEVNKKSGK